LKLAQLFGNCFCKTKSVLRKSIQTFCYKVGSAQFGAATTMRSCQAAAGSRTDALTNQHSTFLIRYGASTRGPAPSTATVLLVCPRHALQSTPRTPRSNHIFSRHSSLASTNNNSNTGPGPLSAEEEAAYQEFMEQRQGERKAWKMEVRRRAKFDPMATPGTHATATAAAPKPSQQRVARVMPKSAPALRALSRPKAPPPATPPNHLPQPLSAAAAASGGGVDGGEWAVASAAAAPSSALVDLAATRNVSTAPNGRLDEYDGNEQIVELDEQEENDDGGLDLGGIAAMARKVLDEDDEEATAAAVPVAARVGSGTVHTRKAAATVVRRAPSAPAPKRRLMPIAQLQRQGAVAAATAASMSAPPTQPPALRSAARKEAAGSATVEDAGDDLDWDALQAYEKYEQYVNEVTVEEERAARAAARRAASTAASTSTSSKHPAKPASVADAGADVATVSVSASRDATTAGGGRRRDGTTSAAASDPTEKLDRQLNQWEQLLNFFEVVERDGKREEAQKQRLHAQARGKAAAAANSAGTKGGKVSGKTDSGASTAAAVSSAAVGGMSLAAGLKDLGVSGGRRGGELDDDDMWAPEEAEVDWQSLERLFLGEGWEAELAELRKKVVEAEDADSKLAGKGAAGPDEEEEEEEVESWADEVSTLLLGLVEISSKRYLGRSLITPPPSPQQPAAAAGAGDAGAGDEEIVAHRNSISEVAAVGEEERAAVFWEAPFLLLVQDDSTDPVIEYANRAALSALQIDDFDEATAGLSAASLVDPTHPRSQQEWLWACTEALERVERYATIPSLRLRGPSSGAPAILASDVTVFRLDSLEEQPIGEVIVARSWRRILPDEEEEKEEKGTQQG
ncbi:hypothetical protein VaNZ11_007066, partial [Volvox africanus]